MNLWGQKMFRSFLSVRGFLLVGFVCLGAMAGMGCSPPEPSSENPTETIQGENGIEKNEVEPPNETTNEEDAGNADGGDSGPAEIPEEIIADLPERPDSVVEAPPEKPIQSKMAVRGITFSCPRNGRIWGTPGMETSAREVQKLGANWFTYHPYGRISNNGYVALSSLSEETLLNPIRVAKKLGMKVMLKPHIAYWGSKFSWRGDITFSTEEDWNRFFTSYTTWIVSQAKLAQKGGADLFSVGLEYKLTESREKEWRAVIAEVRKVYKGRLTYSANWDSFQQVKFWDALDVIGIQAYFPLSQKENPSQKDIEAGWDSVLAGIRKFAKPLGKTFIFTELGYNRSSKAAKEPWSYDQGGPNADELKLRCMRAALSRLPKETMLEGVFLWKWFPDDRETSWDFILQYEAMKKVIAEAWQ